MPVRVCLDVFVSMSRLSLCIQVEIAIWLKATEMQSHGIFQLFPHVRVRFGLVNSFHFRFSSKTQRERERKEMTENRKNCVRRWMKVSSTQPAKPKQHRIVLIEVRLTLITVK